MLPLLMLLAASAPTAGLSKMIEHCNPIAQSHGGCGNLDKPVWKRFVSTTGEITKLDTASIEPAQHGGAIATVYTFSPGSTLDLDRLRRLHFTCRGQYEDMQNIGYMQDAPPRSVIGMVAASACALAEPKRRAVIQRQRQFDATANDRAMHPRPQDYCQGFSSVACGRIQAGVDAAVKPSFCRPGFAVVGSGLTDEELRICYARAPMDRR